VALVSAVQLSSIAQERAEHFGTDRQNRASVGRTMHPGMKQSLQNEGAQALAAAGWSATSFRIRTADGWLEVGGIVRLPFGIDQRATGETGNRSWSVTHLPGRGLAGQGVGGGCRVGGSDRGTDRLGCPEHQRDAGAERAGPGSPGSGLW
jgi:hypothetical protein